MTLRKSQKWAPQVLLVFNLGSCAAPQVIENPVTWYAVNSGSDMKIIVYDQVCDSRLGNVRLVASRETSITTCGDEQGRASFRYRLDSYSPRSGGWTRKSDIKSGERIYVQ